MQDGPALFWPRLTPTFCTARSEHFASEPAFVTTIISRRLAALAFGVALSLLPAPTFAAAPCNTGNFDSWLAAFKSEAVSKGISQQTVNAALAGVTLDQSVLNRDHSQKVFDQTFEQFSGRMVPPRMT